jgi:DNA-binding transcriptional regulator YiaG
MRSAAGWDGARVRSLRNQLGLSQYDFADRVGVRQGAVSDWETDKRAPSRLATQKLDALWSEVAA